jgi:hypothetical protein
MTKAIEAYVTLALWSWLKRCFEKTRGLMFDAGAIVQFGDGYRGAEEGFGFVVVGIVEHGFGGV